jgi:hypothetical protein
LSYRKSISINSEYDREFDWPDVSRRSRTAKKLRDLFKHKHLAKIHNHHVASIIPRGFDILLHWIFASPACAWPPKASLFNIEGIAVLSDRLALDQISTDLSAASFSLVDCPVLVPAGGFATCIAMMAIAFLK